MTWTLKQDENGNAILQDGMPVYLKPDGTEVQYDVNKAQSSIQDLGRENQSWREKYQTANKTAQMFEGIDPEAARAALKTIDGLSEKQILDADEFDRRVSAAQQPYIEKANTLESELAQLRQSNAIGQIKSGIAASPFMKECAVSSDTLYTLLRDNFRIEQNGDFYAVDANGNKVLNDHGNVASVQEAVNSIMQTHPDRAMFMKPSGNQGSGGQNNGGGVNINTGKVGGTSAERAAYFDQKFQLSKG